MMCVKSNNFLLERIFGLIDGDEDGFVKFDEFMSYFNTLIKGDQMEKAELCFMMIAYNNRHLFKRKEADIGRNSGLSNYV